MGNEDANAKADSKTGWFIVLNNDAKYAVPPTIAKKVVQALKASKERGNGRVKAKVTALERGVRLS